MHANAVERGRAVVPALDSETAALLRGVGTLFDAAVEPLLRTLWLRDPDTAGHCQRVAACALRICDAIGVTGEERRRIGVGALLHDLGKLGVPDAILLKNGPLDGREWTVMRAHPSHGRRVLEVLPGAEQVWQIVYTHHERLDGRGYPQGLQGEEVPLATRIVSLADAADAMLSLRPYRAPLPLHRAVAELRCGAGEQFDADLVGILISLLGLYYPSEVRAIG
jgi:putative two-component system response regulator